MVTTVCREGDRVFLLLLLLSDLISWIDRASAIICAASFLVRYGCVCGGYDCVERSSRNSSSEYWVLVIDWYGDGFMGNVCGIFSRHEVCPMEIEVVLPSVNEGSEEVEVISSGVHMDKDDTVLGA